MKRIVFKKWQMKKLMLWFIFSVVIGEGYICYATNSLYNDKIAEDKYWYNSIKDPNAASRAFISASENATKVYTGTYMESIREINFRSSYYRVICSIWFKLQGDKDLDLINNFYI